VSYPEWGSWSHAVFDWWAPAFTEVSKWIAVALTGLSGAIYLWRNRALYLNDR
jgi:hypothetical protein